MWTVTEAIAAGSTLLLAFVLGQLAAMFRSRAGKWWAIAFCILAGAEALRFIQWEAHLILECAFIAFLSVGCRDIIRTRFWKNKSTMYALLLVLMIGLDVAHAAARWSGVPGSNIAAGDVALSMLLGTALILLMAEAEQWRSQKRMSDIYDVRQQLEERLHTDLLTEALSRHAFRWMQQGSEIATEGALSGVVVMFDVDGLKTINDTYGHHSGDAAIRAAANAIRSVIRADDLLFRWGGDEFVAVLPNLTAVAVSGRLDAFNGPIRIETNPPIEFRLTWGVAEFGDDSRGLDEAIQLADEAMYGKRRTAAEVHANVISFRG